MLVLGVYRLFWKIYGLLAQERGITWKAVHETETEVYVGLTLLTSGEQGMKEWQR